MPSRNIVVFLTDDHARWAVPAYGNSIIAAPALDALAARGLVCDMAFTETPVCSPARASFMTGQFPSQHGVRDFLASGAHFDRRDWLEGTPTLPELLTNAGYDCGFVGKWHVGRDAVPQPGFASWFALNGEYPIHHQGDNGFSREGVEERQVGNLTEIITQGALDFLSRRDGDKPFCLFVGYYATHSPWRDQPEDLVARYRPADFSALDAGASAPGLINVEMPDLSTPARQEARAQYCAAVTHIDQGIGQILGRLEAQGDLAESLVLYTADHGLCLGQHGVWGKGNATRPQNLLDDAIRIPAILAGPGIAPGTRSQDFVDHTDLFQTVLDFAQAAGGADRLGTSLLDPARPARSLQFGEYGTLRMACNATHKLLCWTDGRPASLHATGPGAEETLDLAGDPALADTMAELQAALDAFFAGLHADRPQAQALLAPRTYNFNQAWHDFVRR